MAQIVTIELDKQDNERCIAQEFTVEPGEDVVFEFEKRPSAEIVFDDGSPFNETRLKLGKHTVKKDLRYPYHVEWGGTGEDRGNSSGNVPRTLKGK